MVVSRARKGLFINAADQLHLLRVSTHVLEERQNIVPTSCERNLHCIVKFLPIPKPKLFVFARLHKRQIVVVACNSLLPSLMLIYWP